MLGLFGQFWTRKSFFDTRKTFSLLGYEPTNLLVWQTANLLKSEGGIPIIPASADKSEGDIITTDVESDNIQ